ncbi:MAG: hypothetical protein GY950_07290, partial [bacterium]|nr:hypothetical protein [bacterium]
MTHSLASSDARGETAYMKTRFGNGLYAPLLCSMFVGADMDWSSDIANAGAGIQGFKNTIDTLVRRAESYGVGLHIILNYGISRLPHYYDSAKNEDLRNAQWYSDNNPASEHQWNSTQQQDNTQSQGGEWVFNLDKVTEGAMGTTSVNKYALTTMSRYARKLRNHLEAKVEAAFDYLQLKQQQHPDLILVVSAPGEAEMNLHPENSFVYLQEYFCDFSPFAVLEFRDWLKHEGLYAPGEKYGADGYQNGGNRYQGAAGLQNFNQDFGTSFTTWNLKYFHWDLSDPVDSYYTDSVNPDPNLIPVEDYTFDGMMPVSGEFFIAGGFDPPRVMRFKGENIYWDLWQLYRETMVYHYVKDMAAIARDNGFPRDHYYTHQIPAD